jgi:alpha-L-fucosidase
VSVPDWWSRRRFGLFVHANIASVPAFAPIGEYSDWYLSHLGEPVRGVLLHPQPLVEVVEHHRQRWGHIEHFDDFLPLLTFDRFDADEWTELARDAGMGYTVHVTKHHDGLCWWDAPGTRRSTVHDGPRRNVVAEFAAACERSDLVFGTYYSLLDWGDDRYLGPSYVRDVLHPHVLDLVERYGTQVLWGDGHWDHGPDHWRSAELIDRARAINPDIVVNDRWWITDPDVQTFEYQTPDGVVDHPWELCRGIGHSFAHNRAERAEHHMTGREIVALLTEVVAKGGNLLLNVGPAADGSIPELQARPLREAGRWVRHHEALIATARPWSTWGDAGVRYLVGDGDDLHAVDVRGSGVLAGLGHDRGRVTDVTDADGVRVVWQQHDDALEIHRVDRSPVGLAAVYRIALGAAPERIELFSAEPAPPIALAGLLAGATPGDVVQLGDGRYAGPAIVPAGVTLRGLGPARTHVVGDGQVPLTLSVGSRLEHLHVTDGPQRLVWFPAPVVRAGERAVVLGCHLDGHIVATGAGVMVRASRLPGVVANGVDRLTVSRCVLTGMRWDVGIDATGGTAHDIDTNELTGHLCAVRLTDAVGARVRGNHIEGRWWGIDLVRTEGTSVTGNNAARTMRAVGVNGGMAIEVSGNVATDGDSGCLVEGGAAAVIVSGNHWERCRVGLMVWDAPDLRASSNTVVDPHPT